MIIDVDFNETEILDTDFQQNDPSNINMEIGTIMTGIDPDYTKMKNLPQVNGNTLIGNKTTAEIGIGIVGTYNDENLSIGLS